jgi:predicted phage terminase large subunit-like protein
VVTALDPAYGQKTTNDWTAAITIGLTLDKEPRAYILDAWRERVTIGSAAEYLYAIASQYNSNLVFIESEKVNPPEDNDPMVQEFRRVMKQHGRFFTTEWEHPKMSKVARAMSVQGMVQYGGVYFDYSDPGQRMLMDEMTMFTGDGKWHDDMVDAAVHGLMRGMATAEARMTKTEIVSAIGDNW